MAAFEFAVDGLLAAATDAIEGATEPDSRIEAGITAAVERL